MKTKYFFLIMLSAFCFTGIYAQKSNKKITITGTVKDAENHPMANAVIMIDGTNTDAITDERGAYKIKVKPDAKRIGAFSFTSGIKEEDIKGRPVIDIKFGIESPVSPQEQNVMPSEAVIEQNKYVDMGYSYTKKKNVSGTVSKLDPKKDKRTYSTIYEMLQTFNGVQIISGQIIIQNSKNMWGYVPALVVVNGIPTDNVSNIAPSQVESIEILKGASAAVYGSRGYGGVVLIKTRISNYDGK